MRAYLDIETAFDGSISVIGIYRPDRGTIQLVGGGVRDVPLYSALDVGVGIGGHRLLNQSDSYWCGHRSAKADTFRQALEVSSLNDSFPGSP